MEFSPSDVNHLLGHEFADQQGLDDLVPALYSELRRLASFVLQRERRDHTLQTTALVHEAYLRLLNQRNVQWQNKEQFLGIAARLMRRILVDYGRNRQALKRGGGGDKVFIQEVEIASKSPGPDVVVLDEALTKLSELNPLQGKIIELRFFGGLSMEQVAAVTGISATTVKRNWKLAKARLARELEKGKKSG